MQLNEMARLNEMTRSRPRSILAPPNSTLNTAYLGLTIDHPRDEDWYRFELTEPPTDGDAINLFSLSDDDRVTFELTDATGVVLKTATQNGRAHRLVSGRRLGRGFSSNGVQSLTPGQYLVHVTTDLTPTAYQLEFVSPDRIDRTAPNDTAATAHDFGNLKQNDVGIIRDLSLHSDTDTDWFRFSLADGDAANASLRLDLLAGTNVVSLSLFSALDPTTAIRSARTLSLGSPAEVPLSREELIGGVEQDVALAAGDYLLEVAWDAVSIGPDDFARYELVPLFNIPAQVVLDDPERAEPIDLSNPLILEIEQRRDVLLGGAGNDVLTGGSYEEWVFGQEGNDVLAGGNDRQASDLLFGGGGDDIFQIIPDALPLDKRTERFIDPSRQETILPTLTDRFDGGEGDDQVLFLGGDFDRFGREVPDHVAIRYNTILHRYEFAALVWDLEQQEFALDPKDTDQFLREQAFYTTVNVESTVIDTRAGDDEVRGDPEYLFPGTEDEWGIDPQDLPQRATIAHLTIRGGDGNDRLFGGAGDDTISGGFGWDLIVGGGGR